MPLSADAFFDVPCRLSRLPLTGSILFYTFVK